VEFAAAVYPEGKVQGKLGRLPPECSFAAFGQKSCHSYLKPRCGRLTSHVWSDACGIASTETNKKLDLEADLWLFSPLGEA